MSASDIAGTVKAETGVAGVDTLVFVHGSSAEITIEGGSRGEVDDHSGSHRLVPEHHLPIGSDLTFPLQLWRLDVQERPSVTSSSYQVNGKVLGKMNRHSHVRSELRSGVGGSSAMPVRPCKTLKQE